MDQDRLSLVGAAAAGLLSLVVLLPAVAVDARGVAEYYASGTTGLTAVGFVAAVAVVVFLAVPQDHTDSETVAGVAAVLAVGALLLSLLWALAIDPTLLYSFPAEYAWLEYHRWAVVALSAIVALLAGVLARESIRPAA